MWRNIILIVACMCISVTLGYSLNRSNQGGGNYHYEPPAGARLELPINHQTTATHQQQHQQQLSQPPPTYQRQNKSNNQQQQQQQQPSAPQTMTLTSQGYTTKSAAVQDEQSSESVRLPLPLGVASINIAPLPLAEAPSYKSPHGLTSYGTPYPLKL